MRPPGSPQELERRRRRAIELLEKNEKVADVSRILGVHPKTLYKWRRWVRERGHDALAAKTCKAQKRLTEGQLRQLVIELQKGSVAHGWSNEIWTAKRVATLILRLFGVSYTRQHVSVLLRKTLRWTSQKPEHRGRERNEAEIERWRTEEFPKVKKKAKERRAYIIFYDESGFMLTPVARRTYAPRGKTPIQKCWARHGRISVISAITVSPKRGRKGLYFRLLSDNQGAKATDTVSFLEQLRKKLRGPLIICWDRSQIHSKSLLVREWLSKHPEIETVNFPSYAPELNPDEYVWAHTKYAELCNYAAPSLPELRVKVNDALQTLHQRRDLLQGCIDHAHLNWSSG